MWAQLIKVRLKPGKEEGLDRLYQQLQATEQPGTGLVRSIAMRDQNDPSAVYMLIVFESEEKARASRIRDVRRGCRGRGRQWRKYSRVLPSSSI